MAECHGKMNVGTSYRYLTPALLALTVVFLVIAIGFGSIILVAFSQSSMVVDSYLLQIVKFTLLQASLSTAISVFLAIPIARALARRRFVGRRTLINLLALPLSLPAIVVVLGITKVFGQHGLFGNLFEIYGLTGILLAHVFFNLPLAARILLGQILAIPPESFRLGSQLGFRDCDVWRRIEWPQVAKSLPGVSILVFLLCAASFTVVLTLGGGPSATTLEVAIYQALRFDFDPPRAASFAVVQLAICGTLVLLTFALSKGAIAIPRLRRAVIRYDGTSILARALDSLAIGGTLLLLLPPLLGICLPGFSNIGLDMAWLPAACTSLEIGLLSAVLALLVVWPLAQKAARAANWRKLVPLAMLLGLMLPPAMLAAGWFIFLTRFVAFEVPTIALVVGMNALMALPFTYTALGPAVAMTAQRYDRLCAGLGLTGYRRFLVVDLVELRKPLGLAFLMAAIVSLGDLTAISLFGSQNLLTLPAMVYRQMGAYQMSGASGTALVLAILAFLLIGLANYWSGLDGDT